MEQKQTLWIIAAVGIFLLVVIGAALILYSPSAQNEPAVTAVELPFAGAGTSGYTTGNTNILNAGTSPNGAIASAVPPVSGGLPEDNVQAAEGMTVISGTTNVYGTGTTTVDLNSLKTVTSPENASVPSQDAAVQKNESRTVVTIPYTEPAAAAAPARITPKPAEPVKEKPKAAAPAPAPARKPAGQYWVQVAALSSRVNAETARSELASHKIPCEVFTFNDGTKTMYRVRVGPLTTKDEAEYWKSYISNIKAFADTETIVVNSSAPKQS